MEAFPADPRATLRENLHDGYAAELDAIDSLSHLRDEFTIPTMGSRMSVEKEGELKESLKKLPAEKTCIYMCGQSLGLMPKVSKELVMSEMDTWGKVGAAGHWSGENPWEHIDEVPNASVMRIVGAKQHEVVMMNSLTINLNTLITTFYKPTKERYKIVYESDAFSSDFHAFQGHAKLHNLDIETALLPIKPREGEMCLRTEDITAALDETVAIVCFGGVQYYTGQCFDMRKITEDAHKVGAYCIFDLAHAVGNVELELHEWGVDGACWCNYKYMNSGPGAIGGFFIHEKHRHDKMTHHQGWWGHEYKTRFRMEHTYIAADNYGAQSFQCSNPPIWQMMSLIGSLKVFDKTSMKHLRRKSVMLTSYLEVLMEHSIPKGIYDIITPSEIDQRGTQLSLFFLCGTERCKSIHRKLTLQGVIVDYRHPNVIRVAPVPMYVTFQDVYEFVQLLVGAIKDTEMSQDISQNQ